MAAPSSARMMRQLTATSTTRTLFTPRLLTRSLHHQRASSHLLQTTTPRHTRAFSLSPTLRKGIQPDTEDPAHRESEAIHHIQDPTPISDADFHDRAETLLEEISSKIEELQESREDVDAEYSAGVLNITFPPIGTYVLNKQPPNKQIWLSSPITGPKRFDWVVKGEDMGSKEGGATGDWVYLRDGTSLIALLRKELGITVGKTDGTIE